jgi:hypothetical protein
LFERCVKLKIELNKRNKFPFNKIDNSLLYFVQKNNHHSFFCPSLALASSSS